jgi:hypothetical protein
VSGSATAIAVLAFVTLAVGGGCASTKQVPTVEPSGFLVDYSELRPGKGGQSLLVSFDPDANFAAYTSVLIDPVTVWMRPGSDLAALPQEDLQRLSHQLRAALREQLGLEFELVEQPGPGVLRVRSAITEVRKSRVVLDMVSSLPPLRILTGVGALATGTHAFVGGAAIEVEIQDAESGKRLIAAVDERAGRRVLMGETSAWADVESSFQYWAEVMRERLALLRQVDSFLAETPADPGP